MTNYEKPVFFIRFVRDIHPEHETAERKYV